MQSPNSPNIPNSSDTAFPQLGVPISPSLDRPVSPNFDMDNSSDSLCGWLYKAKPMANTLSTADRPKKRWFVFREHTQELEYYRNPSDQTRLGSISIHDAAFIPEATRSFDNYYSMNVTTSKKTYRLLHEEKSALDFWRQTLQKKRSIMQEALLNEVPTNPIYSQQIDSTAEKPSTNSLGRKTSTSVLAPHLEVEPTVHERNRFVGVHTRSQSHAKISDLSVRNFTTEARNTFRNLASALRSGTAPITQLISTRDQSAGSPTDCQSVAGTSESPNMGKNRGMSFSVSSVLRDRMDCDKCRRLRGEKEDLEDHLKAYKVQMDSMRMTLRLLSANQHDGKSAETVVPEEIKNRLCDLEYECNQLKNEVFAREEVIMDKDKQLSRLISTVEDLEKNPHLDSDIRDQFATMRQERDAFSDQNKCLNAEVLNLRLLFSSSVDHEREMIDAIRKLYDVYRASSLLLKQRVEELSTPQLGGSAGPSERDKLEMLTDTIKEINPTEPLFPEHLRTVLMEANGELTDEYGFYVERRELNSQQMIDLTSLGPDVNISYYLEIPDDFNLDASLTAKWERYMLDSGLGDGEISRPLKRSIELKQLLRQGCSQRIRSRIWKAMILLYVNDFRQQNGGAAFYNNLVSQQENSGFSVAKKQIELDINRSLPENKFFNVSRTTNADDLKIQSLKRILLSFTQLSEDVGYCQGLDRIASALLLNVDEEISFWGLHLIVGRLRAKNYYTSTLRDAQVDQRVFKDLLATHVPNVSQRLNQLEVDISLFSFNWFLTLFVDGFHWSIFMKIWDSFLYEGDKVLFRYAIAVVIYLEPILMRIPDMPNVYKVLRNAGRYIKDHRRLTEIAFSLLKSFPKRRIAQKRVHYGAIVDKEITAVNEERARLRARSFREDMFVLIDENDSGEDELVDGVEDEEQ